MTAGDLENAYIIRWYCRNCPRRGLSVVLKEGDHESPAYRAFLAHQSQRRGGDVCARPSIAWKKVSE